MTSIHLNMRTLSITLALICLFTYSCKKVEGEGGQATIKGKVYVRNYNANFTVLNAQYYAQGENVYIIYGDEASVGQTQKTAYDGTYEFKYLRPGKYKVYALSKDSLSLASSFTKEVLVEVEITKRKEKIELDDLIILK
jgi:hypothetical protein